MECAEKGLEKGLTLLPKRKWSEIGSGSPGSGSRVEYHRHSEGRAEPQVDKSAFTRQKGEACSQNSGGPTVGHSRVIVRPSSPDPGWRARSLRTRNRRRYPEGRGRSGRGLRLAWSSHPITTARPYVTESASLPSRSAPRRSYSCACGAHTWKPCISSDLRPRATRWGEKTRLAGFRCRTPRPGREPPGRGLACRVRGSGPRRWSGKSSGR